MKMPFLLTILFIPITLLAQNPFGSALSFDGDESHVLIPHIPAYNMSTQMTIEVRVWAADYDPGGWQEFVYKGGNAPFHSNTAYREYYIRPQDGNGRAQFKIHDTQNNEYSAKSDSALVGGECYHLAATFDGLTLKMYVNGVLEDTDTVGPVTIQQDTGVLAIARQGSRSAEEFWGEVDEVRIWNVVRNADQICKYVNDTLGPEYYTTADSGLVGYWRLDEGSGTTAIDLSVNQNHGSLRDNPMYVTTCTSPGCTPTSVNHRVEPRLAIGPNPGKDHLHVTGDQLIEQVLLVDLSGRTVLRERPVSHHAQLDLVNLPPGIYLLHVDGEQYHQVRKVMVTR